VFAIWLYGLVRLLTCRWREERGIRGARRVHAWGGCECLHEETNSDMEGWCLQTSLYVSQMHVSGSGCKLVEDG